MSGTTMESVQQPTPQLLPTPPSEPSQADWAEYYARVVTEDDAPVDNLFSEKQQRLLAESVYNAWTPPLGKKQAPDTKRLFLAAANVGLFYAKSQPPLVPDLFISLDVQPHANWYAKEHRSYFVWEFGKLPEVVVEIVSNSEGGELSRKLDTYAEIGVTYYVVYDPQQRLSEEVLQVFALRDGAYRLLEQPHLPRVGLRLLLWDGVFEGHADTWLRWCDADGRLLLTGTEQAAEEAAARQQADYRAERAEDRAASAEDRAASAEDRAASAEDRAARLAQRLRELGLDPEQI